ncbi:MAG: hypothetical protein ACNA8W_12615, partial [Bradymonadaceae bacterium]
MALTTQIRHVDYTVAYLAGLLQRQGVLRPEQVQQVVQQEPKLRADILREKVSGAEGRRRAHYNVTPAEVIDRLEFKTPAGELVDEDVIMSAIAKDAGVAFEKPDPLELDMEVITQTMSRPFAQRHSCVPLRREDGRVVIAVDNPYDQLFLQQLHELIREELVLVISAKSDILRIITEMMYVDETASQDGVGLSGPELFPGFFEGKYAMLPGIGVWAR